jgi:protein gp37
MNKSSIEYLTHSWNFYTGCRNQENGVCTLPCWAKSIAHRFGRSFEPKLHLEKTHEPLLSRTANRVGVCFTGDLFGNWIDPKVLIKDPFIYYDYMRLKDMVFQVIKQKPKVQFFFLTKCPHNLRRWDEFPDNAWVGASTCTFKMAVEAIDSLFHVDAKNKWLSIEPMLENFTVGYRPLWWAEQFEGVGIKWVVIGSQTHPNIMPKVDWISEIVEACRILGIPYWLKNNLVDGFHKQGIGVERHQELPA